MLRQLVRVAVLGAMMPLLACVQPRDLALEQADAATLTSPDGRSPSDAAPLAADAPAGAGPRTDGALAVDAPVDVGPLCGPGDGICPPACPAARDPDCALPLGAACNTDDQCGPGHP